MGYNGEEKRSFLRVDHENPLNFKVLSGERFISKSDISSRNVSGAGILFRTGTESSIPAISSIVWVELDEKMLNVCAEVEEDLLIHKNGIFGRVVRIAEGEPGQSFDIGICFLKKKDMSSEELQTLLAD